MTIDSQDPGRGHVAPLIPGAYERNTLMHGPLGSSGTAPPSPVPDGPGLMVPDMASRASLSAVQTISPDEDASAARWHQWQLRNAAASRRDARRMRFVFVALFVALGIWMGIQLLAPAVLP